MKGFVPRGNPLSSFALGTDETVRGTCEPFLEFELCESGDKESAFFGENLLVACIEVIILVPFMKHSFISCRMIS